MRRILLLFTALAIVATGCGRAASDGSGDGPAAGGTSVDQRKIDVYEAAIRSLAGTEGCSTPSSSTIVSAQAPATR